MGKFDKYHGILEVEIDGEKFELKPTMNDKREIMKFSKQMKDDDSAIDKLHGVYKRILVISYPDEKEEFIENFLMKHEEKLMEQLGIEFGWLKPGDLEEARKNAVGETEKKE